MRGLSKRALNRSLRAGRAAVVSQGLRSDPRRSSNFFLEHWLVVFPNACAANVTRLRKGADEHEPGQTAEIREAHQVITKMMGAARRLSGHTARIASSR